MTRALALLAAAALAVPASAAADDLTIYSSLPLAGPMKGQAEDASSRSTTPAGGAGRRPGSRRTRAAR